MPQKEESMSRNCIIGLERFLKKHTHEKKVCLNEQTIMRVVSKKFLSNIFVKVAVYSLWGIRLVILAKREHTNRISRIEKSSVKTGIANTLGTYTVHEPLSLKI